MKKLVIIKVGSTLDSLAAERGDFEDWIAAGLGLDNGALEVIDVRRGEPLPAYESLAGVVITGSHDMVTDHHDWSERTAAWLAGAVDRQIPTLGICYGHQLLAYACGGEVDNNPNGRQFGTIDVHLTEQGRRDPLFEGLATPLQGLVGHTQAVLRLPPGATLLASSPGDPHHAFGIGRRAWGVQFHPEFDAEVIKIYIDHYEAALTAEGQDPQGLRANCHDTPHGRQILRRFAELVTLHFT